MPIIWLCAALGVAVLFPETPVGKLLRRLLIELPARKLDRITPTHLAAAFVTVVVIAGVIAYAKTEGMFVVAQGLPEGFVWFTMFDVATYIDMIALVALVAATVRFRAAYDALRSSAGRARQWALRSIEAFRARQTHGARARSLRRRPKKSPPAKEDGGYWPAPICSPSQA